MQPELIKHFKIYKDYKNFITRHYDRSYYMNRLIEYTLLVEKVDKPCLSGVCWRILTEEEFMNIKKETL